MTTAGRSGLFPRATARSHPTPVADFPKGTALGNIVRGSEYSAQGWQGSRITSPFTANIPLSPDSLPLQSGNGNLVATSSSPLANAVDIAADGTAIGERVASEELDPAILLNGRWTSLEHAAPASRTPERPVPP
jgi:hypothetical protein